MFDILDEAGRATGLSLPRSQVHREGQWHRSVHIWIEDEWERLLLQQRSFQKDSNPGLWDISVAGHLSAGQKSLEAAVREVREEIGLEVAESRLTFWFSSKDEYRSSDGQFFDREFHDVFHLRLAPGESRKIQPDPAELAGVRWVSPESFADELRSHPECFVKHAPEYPMILTRFGVVF